MTWLASLGMSDFEAALTLCLSYCTLVVTTILNLVVMIQSSKLREFQEQQYTSIISNIEIVSNTPNPIIVDTEKREISLYPNLQENLEKIEKPCYFIHIPNNKVQIEVESQGDEVWVSLLYNVYTVLPIKTISLLSLAYSLQLPNQKELSVVNENHINNCDVSRIFLNKGSFILTLPVKMREKESKFRLCIDNTFDLIDCGGHRTRQRIHLFVIYNSGNMAVERMDTSVKAYKSHNQTY